MGKIAFVFSGQGDQYPGMGEALCRKYPAAEEVFRVCDALRPGTSAQCFSGTQEELKETVNTQPCLFAVEMAAAAVLTSLGLRADLATGFSLGELGAVTYSGGMDLETGFQMVCRRGELMQRDAEKQDTAMAAVLRLPEEEVERLCAEHGIYPVNYNCPGQISVAGPAAGMPSFSAAVKAEGGRALPIKVKGAFHSPFMETAAREFAQVLEPVKLSTLTIPVYSDVTGLPYDGELKSLLARQICSPVRWEAIVRHMIAAGVDTFVELGPGKTLCGLISRIDGGVRVYTTADLESLDRLISEVTPC